MKNDTPWTVALNLLIGALLLKTLSINMYGLDHIMPIVGSFFLVYSLYIIRHLNTSLKKSYYGSLLTLLINLIYFFFSLTPINLWIERNLILICIILIIPFLYTLLKLRQGLKELQSLFNKPKTATGIFALIIYNVAMIGILSLGVTQLSLVYFIFIIFVFLYTLMQINQVFGELSNAELQFPDYPLLISNRKKHLCVNIFSVLVLSFSFMFLSNYNQGNKVEEFVIPQNNSLKNSLVEAGAPLNLLNSLSEEELHLLDGFESLEVCLSPVEFYKHKNWSQDFYSLIVSMPNKEKYVVYFLDSQEKKMFFRSVFSITSQNYASESEIISSKILYKKDSKMYVKEMADFKQDFIPKQPSYYQEDTLYGSVSYPFRSIHQVALIMEKLSFTSEDDLNTGITIFKINRPSTFIAIPYELPEVILSKQTRSKGFAEFNIYMVGEW